MEFSLNKFNRVHNPIDAKINKTEERERAGILSALREDPHEQTLLPRDLQTSSSYGMT